MHVVGLLLKRFVSALPGQTLNLCKVTKQARLRRLLLNEVSCVYIDSNLEILYP